MQNERSRRAGEEVHPSTLSVPTLILCRLKARYGENTAYDQCFIPLGYKCVAEQ